MARCGKKPRPKASDCWTWRSARASRWRGRAADLACATCHVIVEAADFDLLPPPGEEEEDMLDLVPGARRTSRLACQVQIDAALGKLTVRLP